MEDAATAEISPLAALAVAGRRARVSTTAGSLTGGLYTAIRDETLAALAPGAGHLAEAAELLDGLVLDDEFAEFLTLGAYGRLD